MINSFNFDLGAQKFQKIKCKGLHLITNNLRHRNDQQLKFDTLAVFWVLNIQILRLVNDQRFKFYPIAVIGILKTSNSSDFNFIPHNLKREEKKSGEACLSTVAHLFPL